MRNLAHAQYFEIPSVPLIIEKGRRMFIGEVEFEASGYKNHVDLSTDFYDGKKIDVRYSVHLDRNCPYVDFKIQYQKSTRTVIGVRI